MLSRHPLIRSDDLDDAREKVSQVFCPHGLRTVSSDGHIRLVHNRMQLDGVGIHYIDYGAPVRITPGELNSFYLVQVPLSGGSQVRSGDREIQSTPSLAAVPNATELLDMVWGVDSPHLVVHLTREAVESALESLLGRRSRIPLSFELGLDLTTAGGRSWRGIVELIAAETESAEPAMHPMVLAQLEDLVLLSLLTHHRHNHSESLRVQSEVPAPRAVRRAMDLCDQGGHATVTVSGMAEEVGISVRALQEGFRRYVGMTPTEYLRESRLRHVRAVLLDGPTPEARAVADVAYRWGFTHLGRFAREYRLRYGELPSQTFSQTLSSTPSLPSARAGEPKRPRVPDSGRAIRLGA